MKGAAWANKEWSLLQGIAFRVLYIRFLGAKTINSALRQSIFFKIIYIGIFVNICNVILNTVKFAEDPSP